MLAKLVAAIGIVLVGATAPASADPWHGHRGRNRRRHYRHWDRGRDYNPLPGFIGGILGGLLGSQVNKDRDDQDGYRDDKPPR